MEPKKMHDLPFEEALDLTGFGRFNALMMVFCAMIIVAMAFETNSVAYLVPLSACELQTTSVQQGIMAGIPLLGILVSSNIWGYLADTRGRRKILLVSLVLGFITGSSATLAPDWITFSVLKFLSSSAMAGTFGLANTYLSECTPLANRYKLILLVSSIFLLSVGSMAALTIPMYEMTFAYHVPIVNITFNSWRLLNLIYAVPCIVATIAALFAYESPKYLLSVGEKDKALEILRNIFVINSGKDGDNYQALSVILDEDSGGKATKGFLSSVLKQTVPLLKPPLLKNTILLSVLFISVYFCVNPFTVWIPYMIDGFMKSLERGETGITFCEMMRSTQNETSVERGSGCTLNESAMMMVFFMDLILALLNIPLCLMLPMLGRKRLLIGIQLLAGCAAISINFCSTWAVSAVLIVVFIAATLNFGVLSSFAVDLFPTYVKAMGVCLTVMVGRGSAVIGINILKHLLVTQCETAFYMFGSLTVFGGLVGFLLPSEKQRADEKLIQAKKQKESNVVAAA